MARYIYPMETSELYKRIKQRLDLLGMSEREASIKAVGNSQFIRNIRKNPDQSPRGENIIKLARVLEVSESWLLLTTDDPGLAEPAEQADGIRYGGIAEAGTFRRVNIYNQDAEYQLIPLQPNPNYPFDKQFAYRVEGDSMDLEHILPGMWIHAVEVNIWEKLHGAPRDGELVVVEAKRAGDDERRELTVKMLRVFRDRIELHPCSSNPQNQKYVIPYKPPEDYDDKVQVIAIVLSSTWLHRYKGP